MQIIVLYNNLIPFAVMVMDNLYKVTRDTAGSSDMPPSVQIDESLGANLQDSNLKNEIKQRTKEVKERADFLLPGSGKAPTEAVEYFVRSQMAIAATSENPYYRLAMKISAFSGEPMTKMWRNQQEVEKSQALLNETSSGLYSAIDSSAGEYEGGELLEAMGSYMEKQSEANVSNYVKNRRDFFLSPTVFGKLFLTPVIYGHINEAKELIEQHCHVKLNIDEFIQSDHSTYFARLVALRMQMSRFLSGRYYSLSNNYGRLMTQTNRLMQYFRSKLRSSQSSSPQLLRMIPSSRGDAAFVNQNLNYRPPTRGASYLHKLNQL